ncbi:unnamed protein product [Paramecium sonneborni]|uniref:separase n=1 Tax=Paramecium sonneborni TaxID=65129 RepID=A0A8S1KBE8_9CILI|nr:unnamed protein product [Paramecium sonneborni]
MNQKQKQTLLNYFCQCNNEKINVISQIRDFRKNDMVNVVARANLAQQLILFQQNIDEAYELLLDLIGLESQNVKCVMHTAAINFQVFEILGIQKQCQLLIDIANNYQIPDCSVHLLFSQPFQEQMKETAKIKNQRIRYLCRCHLAFIMEVPDPEIGQLNEILKFTRFFIMDSKIVINDDAIYFLRAEFNRLQKSEHHEFGFSQFNKRNTLNLIKKKEFAHIDKKIINHFNVEITVYKLIASNFQLSFICSIQIIRFNMQLLSLLYKYKSDYDLSFQHNDMENDPQQILPYLLQILTLLIQLNQDKIIIKVLSLINNLKFSKIEDMQKVNESANLLLKQQPNQQIIDSLLPIFKKYLPEIYHKFAIFSNQQIDLSTVSKEKTINNLITSIFIKQDKDYLAANFDKLYELMCNVDSNNPRRDICEFLELVYLLQYRYDQKFLQTKLTEFFSYSQEDLNSTLLMIYQQLEIDVNIKQPQSLSFEYISIISKLLHLILVICQNPKNKNLYMEYFSMQMQFIHNFDKKLPQESDYKYNGKLVNNPLNNEIVDLKKAKTLLLNLALIERVYKLHKIDNRQILLLKLSILSYYDSVPEYLLLQLSKSSQNYKDLKKQYPNTLVIKEINFYSKIEKLKKNLGSDIKLKSLQGIPTLNKFLKHARKLLLQKQVSIITKVQILEQLMPQLTSSLFEFQEKPKYQDELFQQSDIHIFKIEHKEFISFYLGNGELCTPALFINYRAEAIYVYLQICYKLLKFLKYLGFYKAINTISNQIILFSQRALGITVLVNIYSQIPWLIDTQQWQQITDGICNVVKYLNKKQDYAQVTSENARQSLYRQRRSQWAKLKESHAKLVQCFDDNNLLKGKFYRAYFNFTLEYLCLLNHSNPYLYEKLLLKQTRSFELKTNCIILKQLFRCTDAKQYCFLVDENCRHELVLDQVILEQIIPVLVLGLCEQQISQNICNYGYQMFILVQNQLAQALHQNIDQSKLYMYLYLRLKEFLTNSQPQFVQQIQCKCPLQKKYDKNKFEFDLIATLASFQMNQKRILLQQEDISIMKCENLGRTSELASIFDISIRRDIIVINFFEFNGEKIILISKYCHLTKQCLNKQVNLINKCLQFKDALMYYLNLIQENIDCLDETSSAPGQWWSRRDYYEQQLLKRQLSIEYALQEHIDFIYKSDSPLLILSPQLQLLPWDHIKNTVFNRVLSLGHILDLTNLPTDPKQDLFYVLNPGNDLQKSEKKILPLLKQYNLKGIVREKPNKELIVECLQKKDYYFYIGHGGGEQYINEKQVFQTQMYLSGRPYLLGCSSAQMIDLGKFKGTNLSFQEIYLDHVDWHGLAVSYLLRGCPSLFGSLWPITDKDADQYALDFITEYGKNQDLKPELIIMQTKPKCNLKVLNGAAFVLYGIHEMK